MYHAVVDGIDHRTANLVQGAWLTHRRETRLLTVQAKIIVEQLKQGKWIPTFNRLLIDDMFHVDSEQRPEDFLVFDKQITVLMKGFLIMFGILLEQFNA
jgi:hypothetical protein